MDAPSDGGGAVASDLAAGSIILQGTKGDVAVVWKAGEKDRARTLPAGAYRLRTTRIEREKDGEHWFLSSTSPPGLVVVVEPGKTATIDVKDEVHFKGRVRAHGGKVHLGFGITGADGRGLSVYRNDKRVAVTYRVLAEGAMNYG